MSTGLPGKWLAPLMDQERLRKGEKQSWIMKAEESAVVLQRTQTDRAHTKGYGPKGSP